MIDDILITPVLVFYFILFPFICGQIYNDSKARTFIRFYFAKRKCITWFAYIILIIICSWTLVYYLLFMVFDFIIILIYAVISPIYKFLFVSKRCNKLKKKGVKLNEHRYY